MLDHTEQTPPLRCLTALVDEVAFATASTSFDDPIEFDGRALPRLKQVLEQLFDLMLLLLCVLPWVLLAAARS
jgi:hypothetical protein